MDWGNIKTVRVKFLRNHELNYGTVVEFYRKGDVADIPYDYWENGVKTVTNPNPVGLKDVKPPVAELVDEQQQPPKKR